MKSVSQFRRHNWRTEEEKKDIVRQCMNSDIPRSEIMRKYGIKSYASLYVWMSKYSDVILADEYNLSNVGKSINKDSLNPEQKIKQLERQLEDERLKVLLYQRMIDIAENEFKIHIKKKFGPLQSLVSKHSKI